MLGVSEVSTDGAIDRPGVMALYASEESPKETYCVAIETDPLVSGELAAAEMEDLVGVEKAEFRPGDSCLGSEGESVGSLFGPGMI